MEQAEALYRQVRELSPADGSAAVGLALVLNDLGRVNEGVELLGLFLVDQPTFAAGWLHLAMLIAPQGFVWEAHDAIHRALKNKPDATTLVSASMLLRSLGDAKAARAVCKKAIKVDANHGPAWIQLGQLLSEQKPAEAADAYRRALKIEPDNATARFFLAAMESEVRSSGDKPMGPSTAPREYVRGLFDGYAHRFDSSLVGSLKYRVPHLLEERFVRWLQTKQISQTRSLHMFDAGCGTGLCGMWMSRYRGHLIGVDLSRQMIQQSKERGGYDELRAGEVVAELDKHRADLDLIVAGDLLVYIGDLGPLFAAASAALKPGGVSVFSAEAGTALDYALLPTHRFAHARPYLERLADSHRFTVHSLDEDRLRREKGVDVRGYLALLEKR